MKIRKRHLYSLLGVLLLATAQAGELMHGAGITVDELAKQMGVTGASMVYKRDKPFSKLSVGVTYKERGSDGKFTDGTSILFTTYTLDKPTNEQAITILTSKDATTVVVGKSSSRGKGIDLPLPAGSSNPPTRRDDGRYDWITIFHDSDGSAEDRVKGVVEIFVEGRD